MELFPPQKKLVMSSRRRRGSHRDVGGRDPGVDQKERGGPLAAEQEVQSVLVAQRSHVQKVATGVRGGRARVQLHRQLPTRSQSTVTIEPTDGR